METNAASGGNAGPYSNMTAQNNNNSSGGKNVNHHLWQQMNQMPKFSVGHINQTNKVQQ